MNSVNEQQQEPKEASEEGPPSAKGNLPSSSHRTESDATLKPVKSEPIPPEQQQQETTNTRTEETMQTLATTPSLKKKRSHDDLARQVNRFSHEELEYLERKFLQFPTPNIEERVRIAKELSSRRLEKDLNIKDLSNSRSNFSYIKGQGLMPTELTQVQIKYWFDHQRRKMKKLKMSHSQFTQGISGIAHAAAAKEDGKGCVAAFVNSPQVLSYGPTGPHTARIHSSKSPNPCEAMLTRPSPTGVLSPSNFNLLGVAGGKTTATNASTAAALGQLALSYGQQMNMSGHQASPAFCMPMASLPMTPPPNPNLAVAAAAAAAVGGGAAGVPSPLNLPKSVPQQQLEMLKYIQSLSMAQNAGAGNVENKAGNVGPPPSLQHFKVVSWGPNDVVLPRGAGLDRGIFLLNGNLKVQYYANKDDPGDRPAYSLSVAEGSYIGKSNSQGGGGMMIQAQTHCYCALVEM